MSAASLVLRIIVFLVSMIAIGAIFVLGFTVIEPFHAAFGEPPDGLGWADSAGTTLTFASFGMIGLLLVLIIWFVSAPVREDRRQQFR